MITHQRIPSMRFFLEVGPRGVAMVAMVATSLKVDPRCRSETSGRRRGVPGRAARSRPVWKPAKDTQIPRRRTRRHHSRASALAARRRDPCPIIDGHHGHHGHPSVKTLKKFLELGGVLRC